MKEEILNNLDKPQQLENLYRRDKISFKREFNLIYPDIQDKAISQFWHERLNFESEEISWGSRSELIFIIAASFIAGLIAKIPDFLTISPEYFYTRNISFIVFPFLIAYFAWKHKTKPKKLFITAAVILISVLYINLLPDNNKSNTLILACIHLPLVLWIAVAFTFGDNKTNIHQRRLDFLRYNGDLVVMATIILIAGFLLTAITVELFKLIDLNIEQYYFHYVGIWGLAALPIVGTYLVRTNPQLVNKVSPVIAKVFTPLVLVTLTIYLLAVIFTGKDPYNDREFLLIFNLMLIGVMALIIFSAAESTKNSDGKIGMLLLFALSSLTIIVNGIALSAILFRISTWGITPNRIAVLGGNILILTNLILVAYRLFKWLKDKNETENIEKSIASFLPIYGLWAALVIFILPVLFNFN